LNNSNSISNWKQEIETLYKRNNSLGVGVFNKNGELLYANESMKLFLGYDDNTSRHTNSFVNPELVSLTKSIEEGLIFEGIITIGNFSDISYSFKGKAYKKKNELLIYCEADTSALFEQNKTMSNLNQEINNLQRQLIKEKKVLEKTLLELKETQQMLIHSEKMNAIGKLVAGVAHEINNPISFVYNNLFLLDNYIKDIVLVNDKINDLILKTNNNKLIDTVNKVKVKFEMDYLISDSFDITVETREGVERVKNIVKDLRTFSRLDESEIKNVSLVDSISSTISIIRPELSQKSISFDFSYENDIRLDCYPGQLNQSILNVLINSIQAVDENGLISIQLSEFKDYITITVKDNGCGIDEKIITRIFEPFFTTKPVGSGTGLGLSITYKIIVELHGGKLGVNSEEGLGTEILFTIPKSIGI